MSLLRFLKDRRGGVAPMFALAIVPVFGLVGAAVDYSRANSVRTGMQSAIDATALAMAKLAPTLTAAQLQTQTNAYFNAMFNHPEAKNLVITPTYTTAGGSQLVIAVSGSVDTSFMKIMGFSSLNIGSTSTVKWGNNRLRVALVLDNTGSMADDGKIDRAQDRDQQPADPAQERRHPERRRLCVDHPVRQGRQRRSSEQERQLDRLDRLEREQRHLHRTSRLEPADRPKHLLEQERHLERTANHNTWNGCVTDRGNANAPDAGNYDTNVVAPVSGSTATMFSAEQYDSCPHADDAAELQLVLR